MTQTIVPKELLTATLGGLSILVVSGGTDGDVLTLQADGTYAPEAAAGGSPAGSSGQVQYNNAGAFGGMAAVVYAGTGTHVAITSQAAATIPLCINGAASQSGNLTEWRNSSGTVLTRIMSSGFINTSDIQCAATLAIRNMFGSEILRFSVGVGNNLTLGNTTYLAFFNASTAAGGSIDCAFYRNSAGVIEVNSGTAGTFRDLIVRNLRMSAPTIVPASASATGSEGQIAWDANYIYVCTATNTWKRVAIATW